VDGSVWNPPRAKAAGFGSSYERHQGFDYFNPGGNALESSADIGMNKRQTILLVDDSESDIFLMRTAFRKAGLDSLIQEGHNGEDAIAYLKGEGIYSDREQYPMPEVMLLDLNMPMKNGFDVLSWVRAQPAFRRLSIIILTASVRPEDVGRAFDLGANSFLVKPSNLDALVSMMRCLRDWMQINHFPPLNGPLS
jgi:CheY-like chemotaxis protein